MKILWWKPLLLSLALVAAGVGGTYLLRPHDAAVQVPGASSSHEKDAAATVLNVDELAAQPGAYLGSLQVFGIVAAVEPGKRFVLIDRSEYQACGVGCLTEAGTRKITVRWSGKAPPIERAVRVTGKLAHTARGYTFTATGVDAL